jgi:uncharacterized protein YbjT (DUF2867 family)
MRDIGERLVTVFGGSGFIGTMVVRVLMQRGWRVRVAVRKPVNVGVALGDVGQLQLVHCDVTRPEDVAAALRGADAAVNLVGILYEAPGRSFQRTHVEGATNIAEAARAAGVSRLVQVSAMGVSPDHPSAYARTKAQAEAKVRGIRPDAVVVRPSVVFGSGDGFLNKFARMAAMLPALPLIGGGHTRFQPVYVGDVAEAIARAVEGRDAAGRTFELAGPTVYSFEEILRMIMAETGHRRVLLPLPFMAARILGAFAQLIGLVGFAPPLTRDQVLMLQRDNTPSPGAEGLAALGVEPTGLEAIAPSYLWLYRRGGQFAERPELATAVPA